ncbi:MAG: CRISPR-associated protein Cas4 [Anaerolineae bacterium]|nr:CRISPR-associated protein Cas4 [Anaerolineae bacterium]MDW8300538.1 CRISPR-associated protein Cas4 [Anaerolineae bacterium]
MLDGDETLFTVTDLKQFAYCQRIFYYETCLPNIRPITFKMQLGREAHELEAKRALRRSLDVLALPDGVRHFDVDLAAPRLGLCGRLDELIVQGDPPHAFVPIDYKLSKQASSSAKLQLTAYAMMLEEVEQVAVAVGYLYLIPLRQSVQVKFTQRLRDAVLAAIAQMHHIARTQQMPPAAESARQCMLCEFRRFCNDVL